MLVLRLSWAKTAEGEVDIWDAPRFRGKVFWKNIGAGLNAQKSQAAVYFVSLTTAGGMYERR